VAKLKGPLFSLGASQQLGKALVFFGWKGLDVVREYVIPSNPKTSGQTTQRGYLTEAIRLLRIAQAVPNYPLNEGDRSAYALWASVVQPATTWFNQVCRNVMDQMVLGRIGRVFRNITIVPGTDKLDITGNYHALAITGGNFVYGTSKTALISTKAAVLLPTSITGSLTGLTTGVKYFWQFVATAPSDAVGVKSGIYYGVAA